MSLAPTNHLLLALILAPLSYADSPIPEARMNQTQVLGSHNSYKQAIDPSLRRLLRSTMGDRLNGLEYSHISLEEQLDLGLRSLEIDVVYDPDGGLYAKPKGLELVRQEGLPSGAPYDPDSRMTKPGFKVLHVPDIDFRTHVYTLQDALGRLKKWSDAHPKHVPIVITMNAKDVGIDRPGFTRPLAFDAAALDAWDKELVQGLSRRKLVTPDDVRGEFATLEAAVLSHAWPTLDKARGKFLFVLDETGPKLDLYVKGHPSLRGRIMFVNAQEGRPEAAFRIVNEPEANIPYIQYLVRAGYLVRTRADADTIEARTGDYRRWRAAIISGAHVISTDYYRQDPELKAPYEVKLPGGLTALWNTLLLPQTKPLPRLE